MGDFVHLHLHSEYSLLDGACRVADIPKYAKKCGHDAVALTDHGAMYGAVAFYKACKAEGIKPIIGCEMYVAEGSMLERTKENRRYHLILLVKNETGYRNLIYLVSKSFSDGFYVKPRIDMDLLAKHSEGLIALSACIAGYIPQKLLSGEYDEARKMALRMKDIFGAENYYLEIQDHGMEEERRVAAGLAELSSECGIGLVATNDVHYLERSHAEYQDVLMCIQTNEVVTEERSLKFATDEYYYKSTEEMKILFGAYRGAIENTAKIASMCSFDFDFSKTFLPRYDLPAGVTGGEYLRKITEEGLERRIASGDIDPALIARDKYASRIENELTVIDNMGYSEYFLIVWDFVSHAKKKKIPVGPGRGSGASSLVAYLIGITDVDPIKYGLIFESFLNYGRVSMPDFDIDFADNRREEVIDYVKQRYGDDRVSQIITFGTMSARAVVRDVGRALGMSYAVVDRIAKLIPRELNITLTDALAKKELKDAFDEDASTRKLLEVSLALEGMPRHASTHAAGVVITDKPVYEYVPLASNGGNMLTQFDMDTVAELGLLKFDFLGIRYLTVICETEKKIRRRDPSFDVEKIPLDDAETYRLICKGKTEGTFQMNATIKPFLPMIHPDSFEDIIAVMALDRPGPISAGSVELYSAGKRDRSKIKYVTDKLSPILDSTYGCLLYTEQITQIFRELAGYTFSKADNVRRAIKKKKADVLASEREGFIKGAGENGVPVDAAEKIFYDIEGFSEYAFNKSHATAYAVIAYRTAYLKAHYLKEYYSSLISTEKNVSDFISELKKSGVAVNGPDVNYSEAEFTVEDNAIRFGLSSVASVGRPLVEYIVRERENGGRYSSFDDFIIRTEGSDLTRRQYEMLVKAGALDSLGINRNAALALTDRVFDHRTASAGRADGQMDLLSMLGGTESVKAFTIPDVPELSQLSLLMYEKESLGLYLSGSMISVYSDHVESLGTARIKDILDSFSEEGEPAVTYSDGDSVTVAGILSKIKSKKTKKGAPMAFVTVDDGTGEMEFIFFERILADHGHLLTPRSALAVTGKISVKDDDVSVIASGVTRLVENGQYVKPSIKTVYIKIDDVGTELYRTVHDAVIKSPGDAPVVFYLTKKGKYVSEKGLSVDASDESIVRLREAAGDAAVVVKDR